MGINGPRATACYAGLGSYVSRGENRVNDLECHANCLRERLDRLEAMLPTALIEASIAIQKGERPPDLLQLAQAEEPPKETCKPQTDAESGRSPCVILGCGQVEPGGNIISEEDEPQVCMLQVLARKEKRLRNKIYEMEIKEERYKKALAEAGQTLGEAGVDDNPPVCQSRCPGAENQTVMHYRAAVCSKNPCDNPVEQRIEELEASSKKIGLNLKNLHRERAQLTCQAKNLTAELRCTQKYLGEVQQRVLGSSSSEVIPIMKDPSLNDVYVKGPSCCKTCNIGNNGARKLPRDPEALRTLAGQFKEAYKKAEDEGFSPSLKGPIRKTAEHLRALSNLDADACPCGQPIKCNSCIICSCADWERDLEGGGDEPPEDSSSDDRESRRKVVKTPRKKPTERCHCGCDETSSESDCPCGCLDDLSKAETNVEICPCSCDQAAESSAASTSDPSTITETTIPSSDTDGSGYNQVGKGDARCHVCNLESRASLCAIYANEEMSTGGDRDCEICQCEEKIINDSSKAGNQQGLCKICPCSCTMCDVIENQKGSPPCREYEPITAAEISQDLTEPVECTCAHPVNEVPPEIQKVCKVEKLREGLENLKNRNHALRNILKNCSCLSQTEDKSLAPSPKDQTETCRCIGTGGNVKQTASGLMSTVRLLQSKCRTKDGMIVALADELKRAATPEQTSRILECLADPSLCRGVNDFDRSELWNYLKKSSAGSKSRVSDPGRRSKTCQKDFFIGVTVLCLIIASHIVRSYSLMPPFFQVVNSLRYWMDEVPGNVGYLKSVLVDLARVLFQKQCFLSLVEFCSPYFDNAKTFICSLPGVETFAFFLDAAQAHLQSLYHVFLDFGYFLKNFQFRICSHLCGMIEYLNVVKRFILFHKTHLPSLKVAVQNCVSLIPFCIRRIFSVSEFLPVDLASLVVSFVKVVLSHILCLWTFVLASPRHFRGPSSLLLYFFSCLISLPAYIQAALERSFEFLKRLPSRLGITFISKLLSDIFSLIENCCCSGPNPPCQVRSINNSTITFVAEKSNDIVGETCARVSRNVNLSPEVVEDVLRNRIPDTSQFSGPELFNVLQTIIDEKLSKEFGNSEEGDEDCTCRISFKTPEPPREVTLRARVSGDGLIISWLPPISGSVAGYEVLAEGEIVARIRTPLRTETFVGGLDLSQMVLLEVRTISKNGLRSKVVEKLFNPARSNL